MKKMILIIMLVALSFVACGQKITQLQESTSASEASLIYVREGATGDLIKKITKANFLAGYAGTMTYPGVGIPLSTGTAWGTSITNNSANWNTAYGWGNHATAGYAATSHTQAETTITFTDVTTGNATTDNHGFLPKLGGGTTNYLRADGTWVAPAGGSGMVYPGAGIALSTGSAWTTSITDASANWNTAYTDRLKWDGGATGLTAATGRTSLGASTVGGNIFQLTNPSAITFLRMNADNTVTALSAANFVTAIGATTVGASLLNLSNPSAITFLRVNANNTVTALSATNFKTALSLAAADVNLDLVTNESKATMFANPTFTGIQKVSTTDTLSTKAYARSVAGYDFQTQLDSIKTAMADTIPANTYFKMLADTVPLFTVGGGNNLKGSQPAFLPGSDLGGFSNTSTKDTIYITSGRFFVVADSGTVTTSFKFYKHATQYPTSGATDMMSANIVLSLATSGTTTGTVITLASTPHFDVYVLYPGESIAAIVTVKSNGNMPKLMRGTVYGYIQNRKY